MSKTSGTDEGFGMVEVLVAVLLVGVAALMALPMLHMALENSRLNTNAAEAAQYMNSEIAEVSAREHSCEGLAQWAAYRPESQPVTSHGVTLTSTRRISSCSQQEGTARVSVEIAGGGRSFGDVNTVVRIADEGSDA